MNIAIKINYVALLKSDDCLLERVLLTFDKTSFRITGAALTGVTDRVHIENCHIVQALDLFLNLKLIGLGLYDEAVLGLCVILVIFSVTRGLMINAISLVSFYLFKIPSITSRDFSEITSTSAFSTL